MEIITSLGGEDGVCLRLLSDSVDIFLEPDFKDSIAATAASSSGTNGSSSFSSELAPTTSGVLRLGEILIVDSLSGARNVKPVCDFSGAPFFKILKLRGSEISVPTFRN